MTACSEPVESGQRAAERTPARSSARRALRALICLTIIVIQVLAARRIVAPGIRTAADL